MRIVFRRDFLPRSKTIEPREFSIVQRENYARSVRFSFNRRRTQLDLYRISMLADDLVDLRIRNDVKAYRRHRRHCSAVYDRRITLSQRGADTCHHLVAISLARLAPRVSTLSM